MDKASAQKVLEKADVILEAEGGGGAIREAAEIILDTMN